MLMHTFLLVSCWINTSDRFTNKILRFCFNFFGMLWYIFIILTIALYAYYAPPPNFSSNTTATSAILTWEHLEVYAWFGIVGSNIVFMFLRSMIKPALDPTVYIDEKKKLPKIDTIIAMNDIASLFSTEFVPFWMANC